MTTHTTRCGQRPQRSCGGPSGTPPTCRPRPARLAWPRAPRPAPGTPRRRRVPRFPPARRVPTRPRLALGGHHGADGQRGVGTTRGWGGPLRRHARCRVTGRARAQPSNAPVVAQRRPRVHPNVRGGRVSHWDAWVHAAGAGARRVWTTRKGTPECARRGGNDATTRRVSTRAGQAYNSDRGAAGSCFLGGGVCPTAPHWARAQPRIRAICAGHILYKIPTRGGAQPAHRPSGLGSATHNRVAAGAHAWRRSQQSTTASPHPPP